MTYEAGASAAIMKTLRDIEQIVKGQKLSPSGPRRQVLRNKLMTTLRAAAETWYRKGFSRGHRESHRAFKKKLLVPSVLKTEVERSFIPGKTVTVRLLSRLDKSRPAQTKKKIKRG